MAKNNAYYTSRDGVLFNKSMTELVCCPASKTGSYAIPLSVASIRDYAFCDCSGLTSVTIPNSVTNIGGSAFRYCKGLKNVTIPSSVKSIGYPAFGYCNELRSLDVAKNNAYYTSRDGVLFNKSMTELVCCPASKTGSYAIPSSVTCIGDYAFLHCSGLTSVTIPSSVTSIGDWAFRDCSGLTSVTIPSSVTSIGDEAFDSCSGLTSVTIPSSVTSIGWEAFWGCSGLTSVTIPSSVTSIGSSAFLGCSGLTSVMIPSSVTSIGGSAFSGCSGLTSVTIPSSVTSIGEWAFYDCDELTTIYVDEDDEDRVRDMLEGSGLDTTDITFDIIQNTGFTIIVGAKSEVDVGLIGYTAKGLPKGLTYNAKTGMVTGTCKVVGEYEVTFTKKGAEDETVVFVVRAENEPTVECEGLAGGTMIVGVAGGGQGLTALPIAIDAESGVKSVTATKLPTGMKLASSKDKTSWFITGAPTKAGTYEVAITLTTAAGNKVTEKFTVTVAALPSDATGTFNGFVVSGALGDRALPDGDTVNAGTLQVTVSDVGKITAKVVAAAGTYSFTATGWDSVSEGVYSVKMTTKKGDALTLACDSAAAWNAHQLTGSFVAKDTTALSVEAQKNAFGKQWFFDATGDDANGWTLSFAENAKNAALTVTFNADGKTSVAGKLGAYKITASGYADVSGIGAGAIFADFAPVVTVGKSKKVLSLRVNLWFDRSDDHEEGVGSAVFVQ